MKLYSIRIDAGSGAKWYKIKAFTSVDKCNEFLQENEDFGLLTNKPVYAVARNDDTGIDVLPLEYEGKDPGYCKTFFKAECGRLFVLVDGQLHTCLDDAWREANTPVKHEYFKFPDEAQYD